MNPVPGTNAVAVLKEYKITYTIRYERVISESSIDGAVRHARNIARLYEADAFKVLSIHDMAMHPVEVAPKGLT